MLPRNPRAMRPKNPPGKRATSTARTTRKRARPGMRRRSGGAPTSAPFTPTFPRQNQGHPHVSMGQGAVLGPASRAHPEPCPPGAVPTHPRAPSSLGICLSATSTLLWRMWTPPDGQARLQNRVGGSLVRYCRMSGLLMRPLLAAGPYGVREIGSKSDKRARRPSAIYWFFRSRLVDRLPLLRSCVLLPTSPRQLLCLSLLSFRRPVRRQCEPGRSPFSWSAPRLSVPSCWRAPPRPPSSACVPTSRPATDP